MPRAGLQDLLPEKENACVKLRHCSKSWEAAKSKNAARFAQTEHDFCRVYEVVIYLLRPED